MIRVGTALACLLGLSGCMGGQATDSQVPGTSDQALAAAGSGGGKDSPPVKSDCAPAAEKPEKPAVPAAADCFEEMKRCVVTGDQTLECSSIIKKCAATTAPPDDAYVTCITKAKDCYNYEKDPAVCEKLIAQCDDLKPDGAPKPAGADCDRDLKLCYEKDGKSEHCDELWKQCMSEPGKVPPPPLDDYTSCVIKGKECYGSSTDLTVCDALLKSCEALKTEPANTTQPADDAYAACQQKVKECYSSESEVSICDAERERCDSLLKPEPEPK